MPVRRRRKNPKVEALVVNALRRLQDVQGSSSREISNYICQEYDVPRKDIRRSVQTALKRGLSYGILRQSNGGQYHICNNDRYGQPPSGIGEGDRVTEPCPGRWRFAWTRRGRGRRGRRRSRRRRRRRASRARSRGGRSRRRQRRRRGRSRGRRRRRSRRRTGERNRARAGPSKAEMDEMTTGTKRNDVSRDGNRRASGSSISEHTDERHLRDSPQDARSVNMPGDDQ